MSESKIRWKWDITLNRHRGYLPGKDRPDYDIMELRDGTYLLYGWIETIVTFHGLFPELEFARSYAEQLEDNK